MVGDGLAGTLCRGRQGGLKSQIDDFLGLHRSFDSVLTMLQVYRGLHSCHIDPTVELHLRSLTLDPAPRRRPIDGINQNAIPRNREPVY